MFAKAMSGYRHYRQSMTFFNRSLRSLLWFLWFWCGGPDACADEHTIQGGVPQASVAPRPVSLPIIDGTDIRFARLSTAGDLSLTKVHYSHDPDNFASLSSNDVQFTAGLLRFDRGHQRFVRFPNNATDTESFPQNNVESFWIGKGAFELGSEEWASPVWRSATAL